MPEKKNTTSVEMYLLFHYTCETFAIESVRGKKNQSQEVRFNSEVSKAYFNTQILTLKVINDIYLINTDFCNLENIMSYICYVENYLIIFSDING